MIERFDCNPLITPADVKPSRDDMEVLCAFNAGATTYDGKTLLFVRVAERPVPEDGAGPGRAIRYRHLAGSHRLRWRLVRYSSRSPPWKPLCQTA